MLIPFANYNGYQASGVRHGFSKPGELELEDLTV